MKKKLFTFLLCAFAWIGVNAYTVTPNSDGSVTIDGGGYETITRVDGHGDQHTVVSGVAGAGLPNSFTDAQQALIKAAKKIIITGYINNMLAFQDLATQNSIEEVDMSGAVFEQKLNVNDNDDNEVEVTYYQYDPESKTYNLVTKTYMKNVMSFKYFPSLTKATLPTQYLESICPATFDSNAALTTTFTIPSSVRYIATLAVDNTPIASIDIPANVEFINEKGFQNAAISALIAVKVNGYTAAAVDAFDRMTTVGQTDASYGNYASLTFPPGLDEAYFKNVNHPLDKATSLNKGAFQTWLRDHLNSTGINDNSQKNGWKQFINSSNTPPTPVPEGEKVVLRTYSDTKALLVPLGFRAYIVTGVSPKSATGGKTNYELKLQQIFAIPPYTGVILYGEIDERATSFSMSTIPSWDNEDPYNRFSGSVGSYSVKNYMVPTVANTKIYPVYKDMTDDEWRSVYANKPSSMVTYYNGSGRTKVSDRNFILTNFSDTSLKEAKGIGDDEDYVGFFRVKANVTCGPNKAYLSLPIDEYASAAGAEALVVKPTTPDEMVFRPDDWNLPVSTGNWGERKVTVVLEARSGVFEIYDETTGINNVNTESVSDNGYYTLQGVKVAHPQKGVYVKNGKKIIK